MYTKVLNGDDEWPSWAIMCPAGEWVVVGLSESDADTLLSHLNRG